MPRNGAATRTLILDTAQDLILEYGFAATSVDRLIERAGITKGAFFYHFKSKAELAQALVERYAQHDLANLDDNMRRAEQLSRDPLQQVLIFIGLLRQHAQELAEPYPGCLFASYCHEQQLFDEATLGVITQTMQTWRERVGAKLRLAAETHPPHLPADPDALADMLTVIFEGAFILSKVMKDPKIVAVQLGQYRDYLELLFLGRPAGTAAG